MEKIRNGKKEEYVEDESSHYNYNERILEKIRNENEKVEKHIARRNKLTAELKEYEKERKLKLKKARYIGFVLNDLSNEKMKTEELVVSELLRSNLHANDRNDIVENLKRSRERVKELQLKYLNMAFPRRGVAEEGEEREDY